MNIHCRGVMAVLFVAALAAVAWAKQPEAAPKAVPDLDRTSLSDIRAWIKGEWRRIAEERALQRPTSDTISVDPVTTILSKDQWTSLVRRAATGLSGGDLERHRESLAMLELVVHASERDASLHVVFSREALAAVASRILDDDPRIRQNIPYVMLRMPGARNHIDITGPAVLKALSDQDSKLKRGVLANLSDILVDEANVPTALGPLGPQLAQAILSLTDDSDPTVARTALTTLPSLGQDGDVAIPKITQMLTSGDRAKARLACLAAGNFGERGGPLVAPLIECVRSTDPGVISAACNALRSMRATAAPAIDTLVTVIESGDDRAVNSAASALAGIGPSAQRAIPALRRRAEIPSTSSNSCTYAIDVIEGRKEFGKP